jgi:hypothetical protein
LRLAAKKALYNLIAPQISMCRLGYTRMYLHSMHARRATRSSARAPGAVAPTQAGRGMKMHVVRLQPLEFYCKLDKSH